MTKNNSFFKNLYELESLNFLKVAVKLNSEEFIKEKNFCNLNAS